MPGNWQDMLAIALAALAAAYLAKRAWRLLRGRAGCGGGCRACSQEAGPAKEGEEGFVSIEQVQVGPRRRDSAR